MKQIGTLKKWVKRIALSMLAVMVSVLFFGYFSVTPESQLTPSGHKRNSAHYITMRDGVKIAVDVWLPANLKQDQKVPALFRSTRYIRAQETGFMRRIALGLGLEGVHPMVQLFNNAGYALVLVDARGSGASSGKRMAEIAPDEVVDMAEVVDWLVQQSWSNGKVGAFGVSYVGTTSEMLTVNSHPAVKVVLPLFSDFDAYTGLIRPGGVLASGFVRHWGAGNHYSDSNDVCQGKAGLRCMLTKTWFKGIKPVDSDTGGRQLAEVVRNRDNYDIEATLKSLIYVDDSMGGWTIRDSFPAGHKKEISGSNVPMQVWVSWLDAATVDGAIARYNSFSNPQQLVIAPFNHGGGKNADPYRPVDAAPEPSRLQQYKDRISFLDNFLQAETPVPVKSEIRYYTMGEDVWKTTDIWPPRGIEKRRLYLGNNHSLTDDLPAENGASDRYQIDFSATTGSQNRWLANLSGSRDIIYSDRAEQDKKLMVYDSAPLSEDMEITGAPVVTLHVDSSHSDGAFHVYLEDVAPDGSVTYITEGILRARHRKLSTETPPYYNEGPYHSFKRQDAELLEVGEITELQIGLITTSVLVKAGHRIRIAIAGHDASVFERIPDSGTPVIQIHRNRSHLSYVDLPVGATGSTKHKKEQE
ncbi:MAG: hydrolase [Alphaproteobacteria bacterium]|nr:MAG: hydrolase [Alphaproteobacteria bacterium]